nr:MULTISPECIES: hypothetical protein [unclassified Leucobacter]
MPDATEAPEESAVPWRPGAGIAWALDWISAEIPSVGAISSMLPNSEMTPPMASFSDIPAAMKPW